MSEWIQTSIESLLDSSFAGDWGAEPRGIGNDAIVFRGADFNPSGRLSSSAGVPRNVSVAKLKKVALKPGDILLEKSGGSPDQPVGRVSIFQGAPGAATSSNFLQTLRPCSGVDSEFLFYLLQYEYRTGRVLPFQQQTTGLINFRLKDYLREVVALPSDQSEQRDIALLLSTLDEQIEQTEALVEKSVLRRVGLVQECLSPLAHSAPTVALGDACALITSGSRGWAQYYSDDGALFLRIGNLTRAHPNFRFDDVIRVHVPEGGEGARTRLAAGDVLISITADLGVIGCVPDGMEEAYVNQHIALARISDAELNPRWVAHVLGSPFGFNQIAKLNDGGAKAGLNLPTIRALRIPIPSPEMQANIVQLLDSADDEIALYRAEAAKLRLQKQGLMSDLLTGKVRVR